MASGWSDVDWHAEARLVHASLWDLLLSKGHGSAALFDSYSDLLPGPQLQILEELIGRLATVAESRAFRVWIEEAAGWANRKRRLVSKCLTEPWRCAAPLVPVQPFTEREQLLANRTMALVTTIPTATARKVKSKEEVRNTLAIKLWKIIELCEFPASRMVQASIAPERVLLRFAGGKRTGTLRNKLREFSTLNKWCLAIFEVQWPTSEIQVIDYLLERGDEPCGFSVPGSILGMISFLEETGAVNADQRLGKSEVIRAVANDLRLELMAAKPKATRKAHPLLVSQIANWELRVCDGSFFNVYRVMIFCKLIKMWAALRTSDTLGIPASSLVLSQGILKGKILISKTTGCGKAVGELEFCVGEEAWILVPTWMTVGFRLFAETVSARSFLLPLPAKGFLGFSEKEPTYPQMVTSDRVLMNDCRELVVGENELDGSREVKEGKLNLYSEGAVLFWTGHSDRATLPTWAAALNIEKSRIDYVGRWRPGESAAYNRLALQMVIGVQAEVAQAARHCKGEDIFFESLVLKELGLHAKKRGTAERDIEQMLLKINASREICTGADSSGDCSAPSIDEIEVLDPLDEVEVDLGPAGGVEVLSAGRRVVSITKNGSCRTLHVVGSCWRVPGLHFRNYNLLDEGERGIYRHLCKDCFPEQTDPSVAESDSETNSSSSESSDL